MPTPKIFISFRVRDQVGYAVLLDRELTQRFGAGAVFRAQRSIAPGADFVAEILTNVRQSAVLLAVIGYDWLSSLQELARSDETDWVRREIAEALTHGVRVIPIVLDGATMPTEDQLPADISALSRCQYLGLSPRTVDRDLERIVEELGTIVPGLRGQPDRPREVIQHDLGAWRLTDPPSPCRVGVITGTILGVRSADIWVNSESIYMEMSRLMDFSISGIIRYWGAPRDAGGRVLADPIADELAAVTRGLTPVAPGTAFVTGAGGLADSHNVRYLIHVAAVAGEPGAGYRPVRNLGRCVTNALTETDRLAARGAPVESILFPLLGTGTAGAEAKGTVQTLLAAALNYLDATPATALRMIYFLAYTDVELDAFTDVFTAHPRLVALDAGSHRSPI